ncbi:hypothetical protein T4C_8487 [Trichinella pseudospiralis]|uniref:Uncharacterized protein n=1 Tax=Trichinella pseudospiralis TaxID=6337 RepID=A0A0V1J471_TRIPS|nr:hypothetical protein T4C_8487 [Trichinella pseudospiralis]
MDFRYLSHGYSVYQCVEQQSGSAFNHSKDHLQLQDCSDRST